MNLFAKCGALTNVLISIIALILKILVLFALMLYVKYFCRRNFMAMQFYCGRISPDGRALDAGSRRFDSGDLTSNQQDLTDK